LSAGGGGAGRAGRPRRGGRSPPKNSEAPSKHADVRWRPEPVYGGAMRPWLALLVIVLGCGGEDGEPAEERARSEPVADDSEEVVAPRPPAIPSGWSAQRDDGVSYAVPPGWARTAAPLPSTVFAWRGGAMSFLLDRHERVAPASPESSASALRADFERRGASEVATRTVTDDAGRAWGEATGVVPARGLALRLVSRAHITAENVLLYPGCTGPASDPEVPATCEELFRHLAF
jgi:hypothetical protein